MLVWVRELVGRISERCDEHGLDLNQMSNRVHDLSSHFSGVCKIDTTVLRQRLGHPSPRHSLRLLFPCSVGALTAVQSECAAGAAAALLPAAQAATDGLRLLTSLRPRS